MRDIIDIILNMSYQVTVIDLKKLLKNVCSKNDFILISRDYRCCVGGEKTSHGAYIIYISMFLTQH